MDFGVKLIICDLLVIRNSSSSALSLTSSISTLMNELLW